MSSSISGESDAAQATDWIRPTVEEQGVRLYLVALWSGRWTILLAVVASLAAVAVYLSETSKVYEASADLLVTPVPDADTSFEGLSVLRASGDPTRNVETVVRLVATPGVARRTAAKLGLEQSAQALLGDVTATPVAQSDIVTITAQAGTAERVRQLADGFARAAIEERTDNLHRQIDQLIDQLQARPGAALPPDPAARAERSARLAELQRLRLSPDPTLRLEIPAELPTLPVHPRPVASITVGLLGGLILGIGAVFALQLIDPRLQREDQLRERFALPILARIPKVPRRRLGRAAALDQRVGESLRDLRAYVVNHGSHAPAGRLVVVSGATDGAGKTTTAINLARALAVSSNRVLLVDADVRRPKVGEELDVHHSQGLIGVLADGVPLEDAVVAPADEPAGLRLLMPETTGPWAADAFTNIAVERLVRHTRAISDWVVVDTPPLTMAADTLPFARLGGQVLIVVRLGATRVNDLRRLAEVLSDNGVRPTGFVLVGTTGDRPY